MSSPPVQEKVERLELADLVLLLVLEAHGRAASGPTGATGHRPATPRRLRIPGSIAAVLQARDRKIDGGRGTGSAMNHRREEGSGATGKRSHWTSARRLHGRAGRARGERGASAGRARGERGASAGRARGEPAVRP
ncbi:hypothetical protein EYF80_060594 [Liparis tanakae]|uniref:Uncharacterized protein n=1 Tax=Liparis tanakae TaxID=230148 RepID=A0A4Z2EKC2_9TELE|nr:hypothetical protein EYF80_060594 [Liparis tanakae]